MCIYTPQNDIRTHDVMSAANKSGTSKVGEKSAIGDSCFRLSAIGRPATSITWQGCANKVIGYQKSRKLFNGRYS